MTPHCARKSLLDSAGLIEYATRKKTMADTAHADIKKLSFERAIEELESIVKRLEDGKVPVEGSVAIY